MQIVAILALAALALFVVVYVIGYLGKAFYDARHGCLSDLATLIWVAGIICTLIGLIAYAVGGRGIGLHIFFAVSAIIAISPRLIGIFEDKFRK